MLGHWVHWLSGVALGHALCGFYGPHPIDCSASSGQPQTEAILGDVNNPEDRFQFHLAGGCHRGILASGFPCQPLSSQGDERGMADVRALPFASTLKTAWEQQVAGLVLECVPAALTAPYVQDNQKNH